MPTVLEKAVSRCVYGLIGLTTGFSQFGPLTGGKSQLPSFDSLATGAIFRSRRAQPAGSTPAPMSLTPALHRFASTSLRSPLSYCHERARARESAQ